jgi:hypothetical protein
MNKSLSVQASAKRGGDQRIRLTHTSAKRGGDQRIRFRHAPPIGGAGTGSRHYSAMEIVNGGRGVTALPTQSSPIRGLNHGVW